MTFTSRIARKSSCKRRGAAAVEFAIVASVFFVSILAIFEFGRFVMLRNTAGNAAYEAARVAMSYGARVQDAEEAADFLMKTIGARDVTTIIADDNGNRLATIPDTTKAVNVTVDVPFTKNAFIPPLFARGAVIRATCRLSSEGSRITRMAAIPAS